MRQTRNKLGVLLLAMGVFVASHSARAGQKIIFSEPSARLSEQPDPQEGRKQIFNIRGKEAKLSLSAPPAPYRFRAQPTPNYTAKQPNKDWLSDPADTQENDATRRDSEFRKAWGRSDKQEDPLRRGMGGMEKNSTEFNANETRAANEKAFSSSEVAKDSIQDHLTRTPYGMPSPLDRGLNNRRDDSMEKAAQLAQMKEFEALYKMPSATAPVSSPNDVANSRHDALWSSRTSDPGPFSSGLGSPWKQQNDFSSRPQAASTWSRSDAMQSTLTSRQPYDNHHLIEPAKPEVTRQPAVLPMPKRPGGLLR